MVSENVAFAGLKGDGSFQSQHREGESSQINIERKAAIDGRLRCDFCYIVTRCRALQDIE
jgi:hypothetical protein